MRIYVIEGGVGRSVFFTAMLPVLAKQEPEGKVMVMSSYTDIYESHPLVERSLGRGTPYVWTDIVKKDGNEIVFADPYFNSDFIHGKIHVIEAWCREMGIDYDDSMKPSITVPKNFEDEARRFKKDNGKFIIAQFSSGQSPLSVDPSQPFQWQGFQREYPLEKAQEFVNLMNEKHPDIKVVLFSLPNEWPFQKLEGKNLVKLHSPYLFYAALLKESCGFVGINSCLVHFAGALDVSGIALWGGSSPDQWGYKTHTNLSGKCSRNDLYCMRPYLRDLGDFVGNGAKWSCPNAICMDIDPSVILFELDKYITCGGK